jgi:hypothetical protein
VERARGQDRAIAGVAALAEIAEPQAGRIQL